MATNALFTRVNILKLWHTFEVFPSLMLYMSILKLLAVCVALFLFFFFFLQQLCVQGIMAWQWEGYVFKKKKIVQPTFCSAGRFGALRPIM